MWQYTVNIVTTKTSAVLLWVRCCLTTVWKDSHMLKWCKGPVSYINLQILDKSHTWCSLRKTPFNFIPKTENIYRQVNVQKPHLNYMHHDFLFFIMSSFTYINHNKSWCEQQWESLIIGHLYLFSTWALVLSFYCLALLKIHIGTFL